MKNISYSLATLNDLEDLVESRVFFLTEFWGEQPETAVMELRQNLRSYFQSSMEEGAYVSFIARENGTWVGVGGMAIRHQPGNFKNPSGKVCYIMNMCTLPSHRRNGICSKILDLLTGHGKSLGITMFELHATKEGEMVYPKHGFTKHSEPTYRKHLTLA